MADEGLGRGSGETGTELQQLASSLNEMDNSSAQTGQWSNDTSLQWSTPHLETLVRYESNSRVKDMHPRLYFKYLKSKLTAIETRFLKQRVKQLEKLVDSYAKKGQEALSDECMKEFLVLSREAAIYACGYKTFITEDHAERFRHSLKKGYRLHMTELKNFVRPIPSSVSKKVKRCMQKHLFDNYVIFHLDDKSFRETDKEEVRRRERDPIIFGTVQYSDKLYFIDDWEDEIDNLTLKDVVKRLSLTKRDITISRKIESKKLNR